MPTPVDSKATLTEVWNRLQTLCRRLWDENSSAAVGLESICEEFAGRIQRFDQMHAAAQERAALLDRALTQKTEECEGLFDRLRAKEEENTQFHELYLKTEATHDEERAKKMDAFYQEMNKTSAAFERSFETRRAALEGEFEQRVAALQKKHDELADAVRRRGAEVEARVANQEEELSKAHDRLMQEKADWDAKNRRKEEELLRQEKNLGDRQRQLAEEHDKTMLELQNFKEALRAEVSNVVRDYQAKLRDSGA